MNISKRSDTEVRVEIEVSLECLKTHNGLLGRW